MLAMQELWGNLLRQQQSNLKGSIAVQSCLPEGPHDIALPYIVGEELNYGIRQFLHMRVW